MENDEMMAKYYQEYVDAVTAKGPEEVTKNKAKFIEAYNNIASHYANFDKIKAKEYLNNTLALEDVYKRQVLLLAHDVPDPPLGVCRERLIRVFEQAFPGGGLDR